MAEEQAPQPMGEENEENEENEEHEMGHFEALDAHEFDLVHFIEGYLRLNLFSLSEQVLWYIYTTLHVYFMNRTQNQPEWENALNPSPDTNERSEEDSGDEPPVLAREV